MKKRVLFSILTVFLILIFSNLTISKQDRLNELKEINENTNKIQKEVFNNLDKSEKVKVIIKNKPLNINKKKFLKESSNLVIDSYRDYELKEVSLEELALLQEDPNVLKVMQSRQFKASLQDSTSIVNATITWPLVQDNLNLTGKDQTICVIDTGINFSHQDLLGKNKTCVIDCFSKACIENCSVSDDHGHGTHVAGIIAANGTIKGIAPDANLIGLKILNSAGNGGSDLDLSRAIDWCVSNKARYNISVISMSLGTQCYYDNGTWTGWCYSEYCDLPDDPWTISINNATLYNISVVVSTGNDGNDSYISAPACMQNSISVSSTTKLDAISYSFSNRNSLVKLFAPGSSINSTKGHNCLAGCSCSGSYMICSGTSMAAPHVSGAVALLKQYLQLTSRTRTPEEIETTLYNTGKLFTEGSNNFSRINVYNAIISLDNQNPEVNLISPSDTDILLEQNQTFRCNATDLSLKNATFYLWNSTSIYNQTSYNISGSSYNLEINITNMPFEDYTWNCLFVDENNNSAFASSNFSITLDNISTSLVSPEDNSYTNNNSLNFSCNSSSIYSLSNVTFYLWNSTSLVYNETRPISGLNNITIFNFSLSNNEDYEWNCLSTNSNGFSSFANENNTLVFDSEEPVISLVTDSETSTSTTAYFYFNVSDLSQTNCSLFINNNLNQSKNISSTNETQNFSQTFSPGDYIWYINCTDLAGNQANSTQKTLTIQQESSSDNNDNSRSSPGGGGPSGGGTTISQTYTLNSQQFQSGYSQALASSDKIKFNILNDNHTLTLSKILNNSVNLTIQSNPINLTLYVGQEKQLNLSSSDYYNLYIKLNSITNNKANITIKEISERINTSLQVRAEKDKSAAESPDLDAPTDRGSKVNLFLIISTAIIIIVLLYFYLRHLRISGQKNIRDEQLYNLKK